MRTGTLLMVLAAGLAGGDFLDDFESYSVGQDPDVSPDWSRAPVGGYVLVAEDGGNKLVEAHFPDSAYAGYLCDGAGIWDDGSVSMDFAVTGSGTLVNVLARMQLFTGEAYVGGIAVWLQPFTFAYIGHVSVTGEYQLLYQGAGPSLMPDTWMNVRLELSGGDPVSLALYCNDQLQAQVDDTVYDLEQGLSGFAVLFDGAEPSVRGDNFQVVLTPQAMETMTFGAVKAVFGP